MHFVSCAMCIENDAHSFNFRLILLFFSLCVFLNLSFQEMFRKKNILWVKEKKFTFCIIHKYQIVGCIEIKVRQNFVGR